MPKTKIRITGTVTASSEWDGKVVTRPIRAFTVPDGTPWTEIVDQAQAGAFARGPKPGYMWLSEGDDITETEIK